MDDIQKSKDQILKELVETRQRLHELQALQTSIIPDDETRFQLAATVESMDDAVISETLDGVITSWNPGAERLYGYSEEEAIGRPASILIPRSHRKDAQGILERIRRGESIRHYETRRVTKDGREVEVQLGVSPIIDVAGRTVGASTIAHDITERKFAEAEMKRLNLVLRAMQSVNKLIIKEKDRNKLLKGICDSLVENRGYYNAWVALLDTSWKLSMAAESGLGEVFSHLTNQLKRGELITCVKTKLTESGTFVTTDPPSTCTNCPLAEQYAGRGAISARLEYQGKIYGVLSASVPGRFTSGPEERSLFEEVAGNIAFALHNIELEERHKMGQKQLTESEKRYRDLFECAAEAILIIDPEGNVIEANRAAIALFGYTSQELVGMNVTKLLGSYSLDSARARLNLWDKDNSMSDLYECRAIRKDGSEAIVQTAVRAIVVAGKSMGFHFIARDVTEEKRMRDNMQFYINEVTLSQENERKRIARELHDDTIQELMYLARELDELTTMASGLSEEEILRVKKLWNLTNAITEGLRRLSRDLRPPTIDRLGLLSALKWIARRTKEYTGIDVSVSIRGEQHRIALDSELLLFRIVQEAINNTWRHAQATSVQIVVEFEEDVIRITVSDNGQGFLVPDTMGSLTESGKLGLAGMEERAKLMGGTVAIKSAPGKGTSVIVEVPV
jgi:two-component system sensor histidine kinase DegS